MKIKPIVLGSSSHSADKLLAPHFALERHVGKPKNVEGIVILGDCTEFWYNDEIMKITPATTEALALEYPYISGKFSYPVRLPWYTCFETRCIQSA